MAYDAVIIGAGHNGLAAAVHLAARGKRVAVVEAKDEPGGAVKTREATLPGFRHDVCAMNLSMFAGSPFFAEHKDLLLTHGLAFAPAEHCFASVFRDGSFLGVSRTLETTLAGISALSLSDAKAWQTLLERFDGEAALIFALLGSPMPSLAATRVLWTAYRARGKNRLVDTAKLLLASPRDFLDERFEHPKVKAMMAVWGLHLDFAPDVAGGALFPYLESMANQSLGMVIGQGGADTIVEAMVGALKSKGGELVLGDGVSRIDIVAGAASGVTSRSGRKLEAKAVIANVHPKIVFEQLASPGAAPPAYREALKAFRAGPGTMMIHLALDDLPEWRAGRALRDFAYVHVGQPTAIDPSPAPAGKHVLWVQVRVLPAEILGDAGGAIQARDWDEAREPYADRVMDILETYAPGLKRRVLGRAVFSPVDLERENPNLIGGDSLSGSHHLDQNFFLRPMAGWSRYRTPVRNLYLCGASTWPGAGTGAGSGFMLAKMLAK